MCLGYRQHYCSLFARLQKQGGFTILKHEIECVSEIAHKQMQRALTLFRKLLCVLKRNTPTAERPCRANISVNGCFFTQADLAERWLRSFVDNYCDIQPDEGHVHLPSGTRKAGKRCICGEVTFLH